MNKQNSDRKGKVLPTIIFGLSLLAVIMGVFKICDDYNKRFFSCDTYREVYLQAYQNCVADAWETHNNEVNSGWAYAIIGGIVGVCALGMMQQNNDKAKKH